MSVTAVPLQPLPKGTVLKLGIGLLLLVLAGAGLAWLGTGSFRYSPAGEGIRYRTISTGSGAVLGRDDLARAQAELRGPGGQIISSTDRVVNRETGEVGVLLPIVIEETRIPIRVPAALKAQIREGGKYQVIGPASAIVGEMLPPGVSADDQIELRIKVIGIERDRLAPLRQRMQQAPSSTAPPPGLPGGAPQLAPPSPGSQ